MAETVTTAAEPPGSPRRKPLPWGRLLVALLVAGGLVALFQVLPVKEWVEGFKVWVKAQGALGYLLFALAYVGVSLVPGGPAALMTLAGGAIFGVRAGTILVSVASTTAATLAFLLARGVFRRRVQAMAAGNPTFDSLNRAIAREGPRIVALVRLSPVFPFTFVNYAFGLTPVRLGPYVLASWLAMLPATLAYVGFGAAVGDAAVGDAAGGTKAAGAVAFGLTQRQLVNVGLWIAAIVATAFIARVAARAIREAGVGESSAPNP